MKILKIFLIVVGFLPCLAFGIIYAIFEFIRNAIRLEFNNFLLDTLIGASFPALVVIKQYKYLESKLS